MTSKHRPKAAGQPPVSDDVAHPALSQMSQWFVHFLQRLFSSLSFTVRQRLSTTLLFYHFARISPKMYASVSVWVVTLYQKTRLFEVCGRCGGQWRSNGWTVQHVQSTGAHELEEPTRAELIFLNNVNNSYSYCVSNLDFSGDLNPTSLFFANFFTPVMYFQWDSNNGLLLFVTWQHVYH